VPDEKLTALRIQIGCVCGGGEGAPAPFVVPVFTKRIQASSDSTTRENLGGDAGAKSSSALITQMLFRASKRMAPA
jgi:hypothetical protein